MFVAGKTIHISDILEIESTTVLWYMQALMVCAIYKDIEFLQEEIRIFHWTNTICIQRGKQGFHAYEIPFITICYSNSNTPH